jgi:hypothetical protein
VRPRQPSTFSCGARRQWAEDRVPSTLPPTGRIPTFPVPAQSGAVAVGHPPKYSMDGAGHQRRTSASSTHSCGPAPLPNEDQVYRKSIVYSCPPSLAVCGNPFPKKIRGRRTLAL